MTNMDKDNNACGKKNMIVRHISHQNTGGSIPYHELFLIFYYYIKLFMCWIWI